MNMWNNYMDPGQTGGAQPSYDQRWPQDTQENVWSSAYRDLEPQDALEAFKWLGDVPTGYDTPNFTKVGQEVTGWGSDPQEKRRLAEQMTEGMTGALTNVLGMAFNDRPWLRKPLTNLVERRSGAETAQKFAQDIIDADPQDSYSTLIKALGLEGQQGKQSTHGLEWEAVSDTPPHSILPYHGNRLQPYTENYTLQRPFAKGEGGKVGPYTLEDQGQIHGPKVQAMIENGLRGSGTHPYPMELVTGPFHGEQGVEEFKNLLNELSSSHTTWTPEGVKVDQPRIVGGATAGGHANIGHPDLTPETIQAFMRTWVEDISPYFYPTERQGVVKSRESSAQPFISWLNSKFEKESPLTNPWAGNNWLSEENPNFLDISRQGPEKFHEVNLSKLRGDNPYMEIRSPRSPKDVGEAVENMTVAEAAMQEALRRRGTEEGRFSKTAEEYMPWLYENKIKPNVDEIMAFRSQPGLDPEADPISRVMLDPKTYQHGNRPKPNPRGDEEISLYLENFDDAERALYLEDLPTIHESRRTPAPHFVNGASVDMSTAGADWIAGNHRDFPELQNAWRHRDLDSFDEILNRNRFTPQQRMGIEDIIRRQVSDRYSTAYQRLTNRATEQLGQPPSILDNQWGHQDWWDRLGTDRPNISRGLGNIEEILSTIAPPGYHMPW